MNRQAVNHSFKDYLKDFLQDKISLSIACLSLLILLAIYFTFFQKKPLQIFPGNKNIHIRNYTDKFDNGNSTIESFIISDSLINMDFILREGFVRPYVGIGITFPEKEEIDISDYNEIQVEALGTDINTVLVYLVMNDSSVAEISRKFPSQYFGESIEVTSEKKLFKLYLNNFKVPDWWFDVNNFTPSKSIHPNWKRLADINFSNGLTPTLDNKKSLKISYVSFTRNNTATIIYMSFIQFGIVCLLLLIFIIRKKPFRRNSPITINYKAVNLDEKIMLDNSFLDYINNNFHDSELTLKKVARFTGIQARQIAETISENYGCNFKTYINQIRINESKRLLKETNLHNSEIAYKVGFSSPSHFNRVFKNLTGKNPSEYLQTPD